MFSKGEHTEDILGWKDLKIADKYDNTTWSDKLRIWRKKGELKDTETESSNASKAGYYKITKENSTNK